MEGNSILIYLVLYPFLGGLLSYIIGRKSKSVRNFCVCFIAVTEFVAFLALLLAGDYSVQTVLGSKTAIYVDNILRIPDVCGMGMSFSFDGFRALYTTIASFMWMMTMLFSGRYFTHYRNRNRYYLFNLFTLGATIGVFLSADLFTTYVFFEIMSLTSYVWVAQDERRESMRAAETYLAVAIIGGLVMLMGIFLLYDMLGTLTFTEIGRAVTKYFAMAGSQRKLYVAGGCVFLGFAAKAGAFPLHIWLPKAHPVAPAPASVLLSGILTKSGIFGILIVSFQLFTGDLHWGRFVLVIGVITMVLGAVLALCSIDLKRTLACSSMSQIGFILIGVGMGVLLGEEGGIAVRGALLHMVNHSLIKLVLFLAAGAVFMNTHQLDLNMIRGFGRKKPFLNLVFLTGALGISGIPLFNGYVSKTLLHEAILEGADSIVFFGRFSCATLIEWIFLISGGLTLAYMMKLYIALFVQKNKDAALQQSYDHNRHYLGSAGYFALAGSAILLPIMGMLPQLVMDRLADIGQSFMGIAEFTHRVAYFNFENLKGGAISIAIGILIYVLIVRLLLCNHEGEYVNVWPKRLDLEDRVYRPLLLQVLGISCAVFFRICDRLGDSVIVLLRKTIYRDHKIPHELEEGSYFSHELGSFMDFLNHALNRTLRRRRPKQLEYTYEHRLALKREELRENHFIIGRSLSFGLLLASLGLVLTIGYLLYFILF